MKKGNATPTRLQKERGIIMTKGNDGRTGLYTSRYYANKEKRSDEKIVKVVGGYKIMSYSEYNI
ncbi:MAG: hypothetical protein [Bacteriophage sp.]|nr:MAG: hypothetical protein [Bacteriophage sp.]